MHGTSIPRDAFGKAGKICSGTGMLLCKVRADSAEAWSVEGITETKAGDIHINILAS